MRGNRRILWLATRLDVVSSESADLRIALGAEFAAFEKAVNAFDFDLALERLKTIAHEHNATL